MSKPYERRLTALRSEIDALKTQHEIETPRQAKLAAMSIDQLRELERLLSDMLGLTKMAITTTQKDPK